MSVVLISSAAALAARWYFRKTFLDPGELFCTGPEGHYDLATFLKTLSPPHQTPSLIVSFFDGELKNLPRNLAQIKCPKVLIVSDTHHQARPLQNIIRYALSERYDLIVGQFVRQHLHFFREGGLSQVAWIPNFTISPHEFPAGPRSRDMLFIGETSFHPFRRYVLGSLKEMGINVPAGRAGPDYAAQAYNQTLINLNISLNGDLNLRNLEILAASGFLLTDRLSPESGLELLFQNRRHLVLFDSAEHLRDLIRHYLAHPQEAEAIAAAGHAEYLRQHTPAHKIQQFHDALAGKIQPEYRLDLDLRTKLPPEPLPRLLERISLYECLQEVHRNNPQLKVLFWNGLEREAMDAIDMPRLKVSLLSPPEERLVEASGLASRIERIHLPLHGLGERKWEFLCVPAAALGDPLLHAAIRDRNAQLFMVPHFNDAAHGPQLKAFIEKFGFHRFDGATPPMLSLVGFQNG